MAFWTRTRQQEVVDVRPVHVPGQRAPAGGTGSELDRIADESFDPGAIDDTEAAWSALAAAFPSLAVDEDDQLAVVVARPLSDTDDDPPTLLFATSDRLIAAGNLLRPVVVEYDRLQSLGRISAGFPRLQVLIEPAGPGSALELGAWELSPNKWTGLFWHMLSGAVQGARPDLAPHTTGPYDGLGVPATMR